jgi:hypothetical protein
MAGTENVNPTIARATVTPIPSPKIVPMSLRSAIILFLSCLAVDYKLRVGLGLELLFEPIVKRVELIVHDVVHQIVVVPYSRLKPS